MNHNQEEMENIKSMLLKEIAVVRIQASHNNLILGRIEQMLRDLKWSREVRSLDQVPRHLPLLFRRMRIDIVC